MAETCEITLKKLPSRKLRNQVRKFMKGKDVFVEDCMGQIYAVGLKRNSIVLTPKVTISVQTDGVAHF